MVIEPPKQKQNKKTNVAAYYFNVAEDWETHYSNLFDCLFHTECDYKPISFMFAERGSIQKYGSLGAHFCSKSDTLAKDQ